MSDLRRYLDAYKPGARDAVTYDTGAYTPIVEAPEGGWTSEDRDAIQREASTRNYLVFARTKKGVVWKISRPPFNKKSIPLNDPRTPPHGGIQRLRYEDIESLGTCKIMEAGAA